MFSYKNHQNYQVEFTDQNTTEFWGLFCIEKMFDQYDILETATWKRDDERLSENSHFSYKELLKLETYKSLIDHRATTDVQFLEDDMFFKKRFSRLPGKSTLNNFQNQMQRKQCAQLREWMMEFLQKFPKFLYSDNGYITLDVDASDIQCFWNQEWIKANKHYGNTVYLPIMINIFNGLLPFIGKLRPWNAYTTNNIVAMFDEADAYLEDFEWFDNTKVLERWDAWFQCNELMEHAESKDRKFLYRIKWNSVLKNIADTIIDRTVHDSSKRCFFAFNYKASSWSKNRVVILQYIPSEITDNLFPEYQFFVTNIYGDEAGQYSQNDSQSVVEIYQERWTAEHPFHDYKESFQCGRTNSRSFYANEFKFLVSMFALQVYTLFRELYLQWTQLSKSYFSTIYRWIISLPMKLVNTWRKMILKITKGTKKAWMFEKILKNMKLVPV